MKFKLKHLLPAAALLGASVDALAAEQFVPCPADNVKAGVLSNLPGGWQSTPQVGGLQNTSVKTVGGRKMLVCAYRYGSNSTSIMHELPDGMSCRSAQGGFNCSGAGGSKSLAAGGVSAKSASTSSSKKSVELTTTQTQESVPIKEQSRKSVPLDTTQTQTSKGPGTVKGTNSSSKSGSCPDLAFTRAFVEQVSPANNGAYNVIIVAQLLNRGTVDYRSSPDQQQVSIIEERPGAKPRQIAIEDLGGYRAGQLMANESGAIRYQLNNWRASDEFPPSYRFKLVFDPDIRQDGNPDNDDCNRSNDQIVIRGADILRAIQARS